MPSIVAFRDIDVGVRYAQEQIATNKAKHLRHQLYIVLGVFGVKLGYTVKVLRNCATTINRSLQDFYMSVRPDECSVWYAASRAI